MAIPAVKNATQLPEYPSRDDLRPWPPLIGVGVFMAAALLRSHHLFLSPRFWAEEGVSYYASLQSEAGFWQVISLVSGGNYQLGLNLFTWLATLVPALWAPHVTTLLSTLVALFLVWNLGRLLQERCVATWVIAWAAACFALLPQGYEIYFTVTNIQWLMGTSLLIIALRPLDTGGSSRMGGYYLWTGLCSLTGVPSIMLIPLFAYRFWRTGNRRFAYLALILVLGSCVQIFVILQHSHQGRAFSLDPALITTATLIQSFWSPLITAHAVQEIVQQVAFRYDRSALTSHGLLIIVPLSTILVLLTARAAASRSSFRDLILPLITAWIVVSALNCIGSTGEPSAHISGWAGGRYYFFGAVCYLILLALALEATSGWKKAATIVLAAAMLSTSVAEIYIGQWHDFILDGPNWQQQVIQCEDKRPCTVDIWPRRWSFSLESP